MKAEKVYSKIYDKDIQAHIETSPIWKQCEHSEDIKTIDVNGWWEYSIKFDGLKPVQCTNIQRV
jgi:hypothetical protein